jgi:hypothetical protein
MLTIILVNRIPITDLPATRPTGRRQPYNDQFIGKPMAFTLTTRLRVPVALSLGVLLGSASIVLAQSAFDTPAPFTGSVRFSGEKGAPIYGGAEVSAAGTDSPRISRSPSCAATNACPPKG